MKKLFQKPFPARLAALIFLALLGFVAGSAEAQEDDGAGPAVVFRMVSLRNVAGMTELHLPPDQLKGVSPKREDGTPDPIRPAEGALTLPQNNLSPRMRARLVNNELVFYLRPTAEAEAGGDAGGPAPKVAARAVFPAELPREVFLLFVPAAASGDGGIAYQVAVIDAAKRTFPAGTHLLCNLTRSQVRGKLAQNGFGLNPGQRHLVPEIKTSHPRGYFEVMLEQRDPADGATAKWERLARTQWKADNTARRLCLLFQDPVRGRIAVRTFNEYLIAITKPPPMPIENRPRPTDGLTKDDKPE